MPKFSANLTMMFTENDDPVARIGDAADAGFGAVEYIFIYDLDAKAIGRAMEAAGVAMSVINIAVGEGVKMGPLVAAAPGKRAAIAPAIAACTAAISALASITMHLSGPWRAISKKPWRRRSWNAISIRS